ncbi:MFS general substrate transporter [Coprinopsis marcescibilis]|uniref:MFS general substrate transporter n=1 Tax=Coprinopsis marcescibilis TaxID=230819 RepID=A0A5C3L543_COPMA|nr:MFS general substrate transporter [Coprinopsis marcescibilis]
MADPVFTTMLDEEMPLLVDAKKRTKRTPLPKLQIGIVLLLQVCEPITSQSIYPYINQLISELGVTGGDERKVGYYAGMIESLFFLTEALTVLQWSRLSDHIGRKPVLLIGLMGTLISMIAFGVSTTFGALVVSRCLTGLLNGNIGVMKSAMGELTDSTNRAEGFALMPVVWATGTTLGPLLGGTLARPHERFPKYFDTQFWRKYPYLLPCLATGSFVLVSFFIALTWFKETVPKRILRKRQGSDASAVTLVDAGKFEEHDAALPLRKLLVYPVVISVANYVSLAFLNICVNALLPLFLHMPIEIGGLGMGPPIIGATMAMYGLICGVLQALFFAPAVRYFGTRTIVIIGMFCYIPLFALFPIISFVARTQGVTWLVWALIGCILLLLAIMDTAYGCIFMYVTASAPTKHSLGATNGLSQTTVSFARAIGPALSTSLFSWSVQRNVLGGYAVYAILAFVAFFATCLATLLPQKVWGDHESQDLHDD